MNFFKNLFGSIIYLYYFCSRNRKSYRSVATKGNELSNRKLQDFIAKIYEAQRCFHQQGLNYNIAAICKIVASRPAPRFYVYPFEALKQYSLYLQGRSRIHSDSRRRMYAEIFARYEYLVALTEASGQKVVKGELMKRVLEQEAPSFYYEENSAIKMYYRFMQRNRRRKR